MGPAGGCAFRPERIAEATIEVPVRHSNRNFYGLIYLGEAVGNELLACAARTSGLLAIESDGISALKIKGLVSPNLDFIDVCSVSCPRWPFAVVGLSLDRSLIFVRDLLTAETPQTLRLGELRGTPYAILSADDNLFVLTSKELIAFPDLVPSYLNGEALDRPLRYGHMPIQAVDAFIAYRKHLMVVMDEDVKFFEIPTLVELADEPSRQQPAEISGWSEGETRPTLHQPTWESLVPSG